LEYARLAFDIRLWKWLASSFPHLWNSLCNHVLQLVQLRLTVYGNGWQAIPPFMEMVVQLCITACTTMSYTLCNYVLYFVQLCLTVYGNGCATVSYILCNCVLQLVQLRLTVYGNGWQAVLPFMETVLEGVRAKISGYIKS
jgi:hypothetical protein